MTNSPFRISILLRAYSLEVLPRILSKYKDFRLYTLQVAPRSFALTYDEEVLFPDSVWIDRISNLDVINFIATGPDDQEPWERPWLGNLVLVHASDQVNSFDAGKHVDSTPDTVEPEMRFHVNAVFVHPDARGKGIGKDLIAAVVDYTRNEGRKKGVKTVRVGLLVDTGNEAAIGLYAAMGFEKREVGKYVVGGEAREALEMGLVIELEKMKDDGIR